MGKAFVIGGVSGTLIFLSLVGIGLLGVRVAFDLALVFSYPLIYVVGPILGPITPSGPPGGVAIVLLSAWLELTAIAILVAVFARWWLSNPALKRTR